MAWPRAVVPPPGQYRPPRVISWPSTTCPLGISASASSGVPRPPSLCCSPNAAHGAGPGLSPSAPLAGGGRSWKRREQAHQAAPPREPPSSALTPPKQTPLPRNRQKAGRRPLPAGEPTAAQMLLPGTKSVFSWGEICLQSGRKEQRCAWRGGGPPASLLPGPCPSSPPGACYPPGKTCYPPGKMRIPLLQSWGSPCLLAWRQGHPIPAFCLAQLLHLPRSRSQPSLPLCSFPRCSQPATNHFPPHLHFLFRSGGCLCSPGDGEGEAGEAPNWGCFERGVAAGWVSRMQSPTCTVPQSVLHAPLPD